jgi:hypothetical protein
MHIDVNRTTIPLKPSAPDPAATRRPPIMLSRCDRWLAFSSLGESFKSLRWQQQAQHVKDYLRHNTVDLTKAFRNELHLARKCWEFITASYKQSPAELNAAFDQYVAETMAENFAPQARMHCFRNHWSDPDKVAVLAQATIDSGGGGIAQWPLAGVCEALLVLHDPKSLAQTRQGNYVQLGLLKFIDEITQKFADPAIQRSMVETYVCALELQLVMQLPETVQSKYLACKREPDRSVRRDRIDILLRVQLFAIDDLISSVSDADSVLEALKIMWMQAPVSGVPFARKLSAMLAISLDPECLLLEIESHLLDRLQLPEASMNQYRTLAANRDDVDGPHRAQFLEYELVRIYTQPKYVRSTKQAQPGTTPAQELPTLQASPFPDMVRWLDLEQMARRSVSRVNKKLQDFSANVTIEHRSTKQKPLLQAIVAVSDALTLAGELSAGERQQFAKRLLALSIGSTTPGMA